jgi:glycosyltransferase involved in cell wall biosynthesis
MKKHPLSVCMITLNEEKHIKRALSSVTWAEEIIVIDAGSTDRTVSILNDPNEPWSKIIRVIQAPWKGFRIQRNLSLKEAKHDWVFILDADEACSPELRTKLESILSADTPHPTWKVHRQEYFLGKEINFGIWNPSYQDRFFNRIGIQYVNDIHEYPKYPVEPLRIHEPIFHAPDFHPEHFLQKMNKYTSIESRDRVNAGMRTNLFRVLLSGPAMFFKNYFYYKAYRDGSHGLVISVLEGVSRSVRHVKMWQYQNELKRGVK